MERPHFNILSPFVNPKVIASRFLNGETYFLKKRGATFVTPRMFENLTENQEVKCQGPALPKEQETARIADIVRSYAGAVEDDPVVVGLEAERIGIGSRLPLQSG